MACNTIKKVNFDICDTSLGGITKLYMANIQDVASTSAGTASTLSDEGIVDITMNGTAKFQEFTVKKNLSSFTSTLNVGDGGSYIETTISYIMPRMDAAKRAAMQALVMSEAVAIVKDANGKYWFIGDVERDAPLTNTGGEGTTGTQRSDSNQFSVELTAQTLEWPQEVLPSAVESVIATE